MDQPHATVSFDTRSRSPACMGAVEKEMWWVIRSYGGTKRVPFVIGPISQVAVQGHEKEWVHEDETSVPEGCSSNIRI